MTPSDPAVSVYEMDRTLEDELRHFEDDPELLGKLQAAEVLLVPLRRYMDYERPVFPARTREVYRQLNSHPDLSAEVAASEEDYREISRRAEELFLPLIWLAEPFVREVTIAVLANYILERLRGRHSDSTVNATIIVEKNDGSAAAIDYKGSPAAFEDVVLKVLSRLDE